MTMPRYPAAAVRLALVREAPGTSRRRVAIHHAAAAYEALAPALQNLAQERFVAMLLDAKKRLISVVTVADGSVNSCAVDPKLLFAAALVGGANSVLVAHNHPSGSSSPSEQDLDLTRALVAAGKLLCLPVVDHIIVGDGEFTSMLQQEAQIFAGG
jgi:DNA repair protein RadC